MSGCGGNCACAAMQNDKPEVNTKVCIPDVAPILDADGKCPCGKSFDECCHKDEIVAGQNDALGELCAPHGGKNVC
jgi:hypothetical protein